MDGVGMEKEGGGWKAKGCVRKEGQPGRRKEEFSVQRRDSRLRWCEKVQRKEDGISWKRCGRSFNVSFLPVNKQPMGTQQTAASGTQSPGSAEEVMLTTENQESTTFNIAGSTKCSSRPREH